jgi:ribosomal protein S18 acetylase RimI-like enzyme
MEEALAFPAPAHPAWLETPGLLQSGLRLRAAETTDIPFLRDLYASSRDAELASIPWPHDTKRAFCDSQFTLQHRHYVAHCVPAAFLIVMLDDKTEGRFYLHWAPNELRIVDILLAANVRGRGIGSALLRWAQAVAVDAGIEVLNLHVERHNSAAYRLYQRLGFYEQDVGGGHVRMTWTPPAAAL